MDNASKKNDPLDELIAERKWKPALKLIENRQKKGDKSDGLLVGEWTNDRLHRLTSQPG